MPQYIARWHLIFPVIFPFFRNRLAARSRILVYQRFSKKMSQRANCTREFFVGYVTGENSFFSPRPNNGVNNCGPHNAKKIYLTSVGFEPPNTGFWSGVLSGAMWYQDIECLLGERGYSVKSPTGTLRPKVQILILSHTNFLSKWYPHARITTNTRNNSTEL